jgi:tetratricopeptide (TPR) repeat protein
MANAYSSPITAIFYLFVCCPWCCNVADAAPIPRIDVRTAGASIALSVNSLDLLSRGQAGLDEMEQAVAAFRDGKADLALTWLVKASEVNPGLPPSEIMLARMCWVTGNLPQARLLLEHAAVGYSSNADLFLMFGELALAETRLNEAALSFDKAKALAQRDPINKPVLMSATLGAASVSERRGQWAEADLLLREAVKSGADGSGVLLRLAKAQFETGNPSNAEMLLRRALQKDPAIDPIEITLGQWFHLADRKTEAERWVRLALENHPSDPRVLTAAFLWAVEIGRLTEAKEFVDRLSTAVPDDRNVLRLRGVAARFESDYDLAESVFQQLMVENPADFAASNQLALVLIEQNQEAKRLRGLQLAELNYRQYPQSIDARITLGWVYFRLGRLDEAESVFGSLGPVERLQGDLGYFAGRFHADQGRPELASRLLAFATTGRAAFANRQAAVDLLDKLNASKQTDNAKEDAGLENKTIGK